MCIKFLKPYFSFEKYNCISICVKLIEKTLIQLNTSNHRLFVETDRYCKRPLLNSCQIIILNLWKIECIYFKHVPLSCFPDLIVYFKVLYKCYFCYTSIITTCSFSLHVYVYFWHFVLANKLNLNLNTPFNWKKKLWLTLCVILKFFHCSMNPHKQQCFLVLNMVIYAGYEGSNIAEKIHNPLM